MIGNKIADRIKRVSRSLRQYILETITNEHGKEMSKERYLSPEDIQKTTDELRLI